MADPQKVGSFEVTQVDPTQEGALMTVGNLNKVAAAEVLKVYLTTLWY